MFGCKLYSAYAQKKPHFSSFCDCSCVKVAAIIPEDIYQKTNLVTEWWNNIIELGHCKMLWFVSVWQTYYLPQPNNSPFYSYRWKWGWSWPCFDYWTFLLSYINLSWYFANYSVFSIIFITKEKRFVSKQDQPQPHIHSEARALGS